MYEDRREIWCPSVNTNRLTFQELARTRNDTVLDQTKRTTMRFRRRRTFFVSNIVRTIRADDVAYNYIVKRVFVAGRNGNESLTVREITV